jgi:hypothetical protein
MKEQTEKPPSEGVFFKPQSIECEKNSSAAKEVLNASSQEPTLHMLDMRRPNHA